MRLSLALALVSMFVSAPVLGAEDDEGGGKKKKGKEEDKASGGSSMDTGTDPALSEKSDDGPFAPKSKPVVIDKKTCKLVPAVKARPRDPILVYLEPLIGFGQTYAGASGEESAPDGTVITVEAGGRYDLSPKLSLGLRLAWSTANIDQPGGTSLSAAAFAAPELRLEYRHSFSPLTTLPIFFGLGIPVAQGNPDPSGSDTAGRNQAAVNGLADASHGLRDPELYQPKRLPVILGAGLYHDRNGLDLHVWSKFVFGVDMGTDISDPDFFAPAGTIKSNGLAIRNVTLAGITYEFLAKPALFAGLDAWFSYRAIEPIEFESSIGASQETFQFVVEPRVGARFGKLGVAAGFLMPVGGPLGDSGINGVRLHASYAL